MQSALSVGFQEAHVARPAEMLATDFGKRNSYILNQRRGGGYWLWKPFIIATALRAMGDTDVLFYCDAGRSGYYRFARFPSVLVDRVRREEQGILLGPAIPHLGPLSCWTKRDCLVLMAADLPTIANAPLVYTWSLWRPTRRAFEVLEAWQHYCEDRRCLTDDANVCGLPNYPDFRAHRHDQSILSILAHQTGAPRLDFGRTLVHKLIETRPRSALSQTFYKRPQNADDLLRWDNPYLLAREYVRLKLAR